MSGVTTIYRVNIIVTTNKLGCRRKILGPKLRDRLVKFWELILGLTIVCGIFCILSSYRWYDYRVRNTNMVFLCMHFKCMSNTLLKQVLSSAQRGEMIFFVCVSNVFVIVKLFHCIVCKDSSHVKNIQKILTVGIVVVSLSYIW